MIAGPEMLRLQLGLSAAVGVAAVVEDLRSRTISNWTSGAAMVGGLLLHGLHSGWRGLGSAVLGLLGGFFVFFLFYLAGGMGGGDIKLMAGFGALLGGLSSLLQAALWAAAAGGIFALTVLLYRALRKYLLRWVWGKKGAGAGSESPFIPYAPAITAGAWMALLAAS